MFIFDPILQRFKFDWECFRINRQKIREKKFIISFKKRVMGKNERSLSYSKQKIKIRWRKIRKT